MTKKTIKSHLLGLTLFFFPFFILGQQSKIDSLKDALKTSKIDTVSVNLLNEIAHFSLRSEPVKTIEYAKAALDLATKNNFDRGMALANKWVAWGYIFIGDYYNGLNYGLNSIRILEVSGDEKELASLYRLMGSIYFFHGQLTPNLKDFYKSNEYQIKSIEIDKKIGDKIGVAAASGNLSLTSVQIAQLTHKLDDYNKAISFALEAHSIFTELGIADDMPNAEANLADAYLACGKFSKSDSLLQKALELYTKSLAGGENSYREPVIMQCLNGIGEVYIQFDEFNKALPFFLKAFDVSKRGKSAELLKQSCEGLAFVYSRKSDFENAFKYQVLLKQYSDSLSNENNTKVIASYEFEKEAEKKELESKAKEAEHQSEIRQQKIILYSVSLGLLLVLLLTFFIFRGFKQKQKSNILLSEKNKIIEEKQKEVMDSIRYARRIQTSLLPTHKYIDKTINRLNNK